MSADNTISAQVCIPRDRWYDMKDFAFEKCKREIAEGLFDYLWKNKSQRTCVSIKQNQYPSDDGRLEFYSISCDLVAVQEYPRIITMPAYETMTWRALSCSAIDEIRRRVKSWIRGRK